MHFLTRVDKILLSIATLVLVVFSYFLYDDTLLFPPAPSSPLDKVGQIHVSSNDVRVKTATAFAWSPAGKSMDVHQKDSVFTGEKSEVSILLNDGSVIDLKENSLVTLNIKDGQMTLDLKYGDLIGKLTESSEIKVKAGKEEYSLSGEKSDTKEKPIIRLNKSRTGQLDLKLQGGQAKIKTQRETRQLEKGTAVAVAPKGELKLVPKEPPKPAAPPITLSTANGMTFSADSGQVPVTWQSSQKLPHYLVEVSKDEKFSTVLWKTETEIEQALVDVKGFDGTYYWRVSGKGPDGKIVSSSTPHQFKVSAAVLAAPRITFPEADRPLTFELKANTPPAQQVAEFKMAWSGPRGVNYQFQLAKDSEFKNVVKTGATQTLEYPSSKLPAGEYFLRVRTFKDDRNISAWSEVRNIKLEITMEKLERPEPPQLAKKLINFSPAPDPRNPASMTSPEISWSKPKGAVSYKIQVSQKSDFSDSKPMPLKEEKYVHAKYEGGTTYFRVYAISARNIASLPSETGVLKILLNDPRLSPLKSVTVNNTAKGAAPPPQEIKPTWSTVPTAQKYRVELSRSKDFSKSQKFEVAGSATAVTLPAPGEYSLRVIALGANGQPISKYSNVEEVSYIFKTPLPTPPLLEPFDKATVFLQADAEPFIWLEWKSVTDARGYVLEVSTSPKFDNTVIKIETQEGRFLIKQKIPYGKIYWRVRALAEKPEMHSDWTKTREFSILFKKNETFQ